MKLLIIIYHYIRKSFPKKGFYGITPKQFLDQIESIKKHGYTFISLEQIKQKEYPSKACLLTFDDGLKEHYDIYQTLHRQDIPAAFFVSINPLYHGKALQIHKMHYILSQSNPKDLLLDFENVLSLTSEIREQYPWGDENTAILKYLLYFILSEEQRNKIIKKWFNRLYVGSEHKFVRETYMNTAQVRRLGQEGYIGTHTVSHKPLATLELDEIVKEIRDSKQILESIIDNEIYAISYPFGGKTAVNGKVVKTCQQYGLSIGFTIEKGINTIKDLTENPLLLKRYDTINAYGGIYDELSRI